MTTVRASKEGLERIDRARKRFSWTKTHTESWWQDAQVSQSTLRRFWAREPIRQDNFIAICKAVKVDNWEEVADHAFEDRFSRIETNDASALPVVLSELPEGPVDLASVFYVERPPVESRCYETILHTGALIRIKAPRQMGKTSLLDRICDQAKQRYYKVVRLNFLKAEEAIFSSLDRFLRWFCAFISQELKLPGQPKDYWDEDRGSIVNCTTYFQEQVLEQINHPIVLALDEVDRIFQFQEVAQGFFPMLRSWHEEAATIEVWEQLRLIVAHSTEDYGPLDINQSPFNVGLPIELTEFTPEQVLDLIQRHQLDKIPGLLDQLMAIVGGHPYLIRLALCQLAWQFVTLDQLLQEAATDAGIYKDHLRRHLDTFQHYSGLAAVFSEVITAVEPPRLETMQAYKLYSMGLVKRLGDRVTPRCQLYRDYFRERLERNM